MTKAKTKAAVRIVILHRGDLGAFGYKDVKTLSVSRRRAALRLAAERHGWGHLVRKLNALYVFNKYRNPALAGLFRADRDYARAQKADKS